MKQPIFLILLLALILSCNLRNSPINKTANEKFIIQEKLKFEFNILPEKVSDLNQKGIRAYYNSQLLATFKQINISDSILELSFPKFLIHENFEVENIKGENRNDLKREYDYSIILDPFYEYNTEILKPGQFLIDTINLITDFNFYQSGPEILQIRINKNYFDEDITSNWDTLIIE
ncbi:MAG: hypothetical protein AB8F94_04995 [Saprospiraceae bacterium]